MSKEEVSGRQNHWQVAVVIG